MATATDGNTKSKRPSGSKFKQQKLPAWQPIMTAGSVMPTFFVIAVLFIPIGIGLFITSNSVEEFEHDYTNCVNGNDEICADFIAKQENSGKICECEIDIKIERDIESDVFIYYELSNFYQNHRRYVKSRDDDQLRGQDVDTLNEDCEPFRKNGSKQIAPCGAIANSMFNDSIILLFGSDKVKTLNTGIAWNSDRNVKFQNPSDVVGYFSDRAKPPNWPVSADKLDANPDNTGFVNEDFIVWMRTAALPIFRKLYRRIDHSVDGYDEKLRAGDYKLKILYNYPVKLFNGAKKVIISNTSWLGGKNPFLGIAYITVGCVCFVLGIVFLIIHMKWGKTPEDITNINPRTT